MADFARELDAAARPAREMMPSFSYSKVIHVTIRRSSTIALLAALALLYASSMFAQVGPQQGGSEIQLWTAGGHSVSGGRGNTGIFDFGLRYGWILLDSHGPSFLKGRFEYAIDAVPLYLIFQPRNTAYGIGVNPLNLKWNFERHRHVVPYAELSGGLLFTTHDVPVNTSSTNFTPSAALGFHYLADKLAWTLEGRYLHISDAGLSHLNPGVNTFEMRIEIGKFRK